MLKASALYIVIIIALVIGLLCSSLIVVAYFYRLQYQKTCRRDRLQDNLSSGITILMASQESSFDKERAFSLFGGNADSVALKKIPWGIYDIGVSAAFIQQDTLYKVFSIASGIDSAKWAALYVIDEDRPLSVSGKTAIKGDAYRPKAGIKEAYVDNKSYQGDKRLVTGQIHNSDKKLPELNSTRLNQLEAYFNRAVQSGPALLKLDSVKNSFLSATLLIRFGKKVETLKNIRLAGNIILFADTTLVIDSSARLDNVLIYAKAIIVKKGFKGTCQLFATDSIGVERDCRFNYPSCLGVLHFQSAKYDRAGRIAVGENTQLSGLVFTYDKNYDRNKPPLIDLGKNVTITGQVYSQGILGIKDGLLVNGSVFTGRFLYQSSFTRYENYLINATLDAGALSPYYLTGDLMPVAAKKKKILQWLEAN